MLTHLLTGDPRTPAAALRAVAGRPYGTTTALELATHPNLPDDVIVTIDAISPEGLHAALTDPDLPAGRRHAFLDAASPRVFTEHLHRYDALSTADIAHYAAEHPGHDTDALLANPHTPLALVQDALTTAANLWAQTTFTTWTAPTIRTCAAALRHHGVTPAYPAAVTRAAATPDPMGAFARHLIDHIVSTHRHDLWATAITATGDATLAQAALDSSADSAPHSPAIAAAIVSSPRLPAPLRHEGANRDWHTDAACQHLGLTAPPSAHATLATSRNAWVLDGLATNARADAATLTALLTNPACSVGEARTEFIHWAIATHPHATPAIRSTAFARANQARTRTAGMGAKDVLQDLQHLGLLDAPLPQLRSTLGLNAERLHLRHHLLHAHRAHHPDVFTDAETLTFLSLEANFTGTLRQLLDTTRRIAA